MASEESATVSVKVDTVSVTVDHAILDEFHQLHCEILRLQQRLQRALREIYRFADLEAKIARKQGDQASEKRDFRAADRHDSYAKAMQKIRARCIATAREQFIADVTEEAEKPTEQEPSE